MVRLEDYKTSKLLSALFYILIGIIILAHFLFVGLNKEAFQESFVSGKALEFGSYLVTLITYLAFMLVAFALPIFTYIRVRTLKQNQHPATTPHPRWYRIFTVDWILSSENSLLYEIGKQIKKKRNPFEWIKNPIILLFLGILIFTPFMLLLANGQTQLAVSGVPNLQLAQQVTPQSELSSGAFLPGYAENGLLLIFFSLFSGVIALVLALLGNRSKWVWFAIIFLLCIAMGFMFAGFHKIVSGNSDASYIGHFIFGFMGTFLTLLTGSFILFLEMHIFNNAGLILNTIVTANEKLQIIGWTVWALVVILTIGIWIYLKKKKKIAYGIPS